MGEIVPAEFAMSVISSVSDSARWGANNADAWFGVNGFRSYSRFERLTFSKAPGFAGGWLLRDCG